MDVTEFCTAPHWPERRSGRFASRIADAHADPGALTAGGPAALSAAGHRFRGIGLLGLADDRGVALNGGRTGAAGGPRAFRRALAGYGAARSVALADFDVPVVDLGDIVPGDSLDETHDRVTATVRAMLDADLMPVGIGGGHDMAFPELRAVVDGLTGPAGLDLDGIYFDAHLDVREEPGSGMPFRAIVEHGGIGTLALHGFDPLSNTPEHLAWFRDHGGNLVDWPAHQWPRSSAQFVSVCLDVVAMAEAPGVSAPAPAGWPAARLAEYVEQAGRQPAVCCFDIMELSPPYDEQDRTARLAAHLFLRFLAGLAQRPAA
ncbi:MAG: formimidoylglutamase [Wenzhouxiangellaceae bacterium]|nr:formimidoylglutamase [Wenzhouxiangellaceae bacterium]